MRARSLRALGGALRLVSSLASPRLGSGGVWARCLRPASSSAIPLGPGAVETLEQYDSIPIERIRNFCIIAHVDHGKSTLADRLMTLAGCIPEGSHTQLLDFLEVERERGITVKAQTVSVVYRDRRTQLDYLLNLIDTPGHVDFSYEVSRSISACEGALLLVDATQGVQAQTIANHRLAQQSGLKEIPIITKIDVSTADPDRCLNQMEKILAVDTQQFLMVSAKTGEGCADIFPAIIDGVPPPRGSANRALRARICDSWYNTHSGVICLVQVFDGRLSKGDTIVSMNQGKVFESHRFTILASCFPVLGVWPPSAQVGFLITRSREMHNAWIGDTLVHPKQSGLTALPGYKKLKHMIFSSIYPIDTQSFEQLNLAVQKLLLNDSSVTVVKEQSESLGMGLRCGFLGVLHKDIFYERLQKEFDTDVIMTAPSVPYTAFLKAGGKISVEKASDLPPCEVVEHYEEPMALVEVIASIAYLKEIQEFIDGKRSTMKSIQSIDEEDVLLQYEVPWNEMVHDFYDSLIRISSGTATIDYHEIDPKPADIQKVDILLNKRPVDALSFVCDRKRVDSMGRELVERLCNVIPRQQFEVIIQAAVGRKIFAAKRKAPFRKNVLEVSGKVVGGGDQGRKQKLLEKQRKGKKKMKTIGNIELPQSAFLEIMRK